MKWWKEIEERLGGGPGGVNRTNTIRWIIIAAGVGTILMILNSYLAIGNGGPYSDHIPSASGNDPPSGTDIPAFQSSAAKDTKFGPYEAAYEDELKSILEKIVGVGVVDVLVTIDSTEEIVTERNMSQSDQVTTEKDPNGAQRHVTQTTRSGEIVLYSVSGGQTPLIRKTIKPTIRGVFIVAEGAENITVKKLMIEAVERGLGVPAHKISIAPRKR